MVQEVENLQDKVSAANETAESQARRLARQDIKLEYLKKVYDQEVAKADDIKKAYDREKATNCFEGDVYFKKNEEEAAKAAKQ